MAAGRTRGRGASGALLLQVLLLLLTPPACRLCGLDEELRWFECVFDG